VKEGRLQKAHRLLMERGPMSSSALAGLMGINPCHASAVLSCLMTDGGCEAIDRLVNPEKKHTRINLYRAVPGWQPRIRPHPGNTPKIGITAEDHAWMQRQRDISDARRARIAAINEVRARV